MISAFASSLQVRVPSFEARYWAIVDLYHWPYLTIYTDIWYICIIRLYSNKNNNNSNNNIRIYNIYIYIHMFDEILLHMTQAALSSGWPLFGLSHSCSSLSPHSIRAFHVQQPRLVILQEGLFKLGRLAAHQSLLGPGGGWRWMKSAKKKVCAAWRYSLVRHWGSMAQVCEDWITSEIGHILPGLKSGMWFQEALPLRAALQNWLEADAGEELLKLGAISYGLHEMKEDLIRFVHPVLEHVWWKPRLEWETCLSPVSLSHWGHCCQSELACQPHDYGAVWSPCPSSVKTNQVRQQSVSAASTFKIRIRHVKRETADFHKAWVMLSTDSFPSWMCISHRKRDRE